MTRGDIWVWKLAFFHSLDRLVRQQMCGLCIRELLAYSENKTAVTARFQISKRDGRKKWKWPRIVHENNWCFTVQRETKTLKLLTENVVVTCGQGIPKEKKLSAGKMKWHN